MTREDAVAIKAVRKSTLKSLKLKKRLRISQIKKEAETKIREINIQYADDPERLKAKYAAADYARSEKAKRRAEAKIAREKKHQEFLRSLRHYTLGEEIFSSVVQGIGAGLFIAATVLLIVAATVKVPEDSKTVYTALFASFGGVMVLNYIMSVLHHALTNHSAKEVFKRLCRVCIYLVIASSLMIYSYTAVRQQAVEPLYALIILGIAGIICLVGIFMYAIGGTRMEIVNIVFNGVLGWACLFICARLYHAITPKSFGMLVISGVLFTTGLVFCSIRRAKFLHAIGDLIVLTASVYMFFSFFYLY
ncbi:MAG: hemolysin III family protein [Treponema sp.]|nr:hemolysin III family protein [Treponema sp.]